MVLALLVQGSRILLFTEKINDFPLPSLLAILFPSQVRGVNPPMTLPNSFFTRVRVLGILSHFWWKAATLKLCSEARYNNLKSFGCRFPVLKNYTRVWAYLVLNTRLVVEEGICEICIFDGGLIFY